MAPPAVGDTGSGRLRPASVADVTGIASKHGAGVLVLRAGIRMPDAKTTDDKAGIVGWLCTTAAPVGAGERIWTMDPAVAVRFEAGAGRTLPGAGGMIGLTTSLASAVTLRVVMTTRVPEDKELLVAWSSEIRKWMLNKVVCPTAQAVLPSHIPAYCVVTSTSPSNAFVLLSPATHISVLFHEDDAEEDTIVNNPQMLVAGMSTALEQLRDVVLAPLLYPDLLKSVGFVPSAGLLLHGPPGVGKTLLVRQILAEADRYVPVKLLSIHGPEVVSPIPGESERQLRELFDVAREFVARRHGLCIMFFDEMDAMCTSRESASPVQARIVTQLLALMDGLVKHEREGHFVVIGATNRPDVLDAALRRPGRLDREIRIEAPNTEARLAILQLCSADMPLDAAAREALPVFAERMVGYVGADIAALCREACLRALDRNADVSPADLEAAMTVVGASAMRAVRCTVPNTQWEEIGGLDDIKLRLQQSVIWPLRHAAAFATLGLRRPSGVILHGPPGCSKTTLVKAAATACGASFVALSGADVFSPFVGEAERKVREIFHVARQAAPAIVFFDEIDAMVSKRDLLGGGGGASGSESGVLATLLNEMDGIEASPDVMVMAATNRLDCLDAALLRPGRFDVQLYIGLPPAAARTQVLQVHLRRSKLSDDVDLGSIAAAGVGYTGAELEAVCREACLLALREDIAATCVSQRHLLAALALVKPQHATSAEAT